MIYLFLADGFEECEALIPLDILRRAEISVKTVGINKITVTGTHGISVNCDITDENLSFCDLTGIILPGGLPGAVNLENSKTVQSALDFCHKNNLLISAICAAPQILGHKNFLNGINATCFPGFESELNGAVISDRKVVRDKNIITACAVGAAFDFGFEILDYLTNRETVKKLKSNMKY